MCEGVESGTRELRGLQDLQGGFRGFGSFYCGWDVISSGF